jgi:Na+/proline symporter
MTTTEVGNGLVLPYAAITIAGKGGAAAVLLITFMACTSTLSAQVIAVSSILSFDVYREYFNKKATDYDLIRASHFGVIFFAVFSAAFSTMLHYVGINLGWTLYMLGMLSLRTLPSISKLTLFFSNRCGYMSRNLPNDLHNPLASPKQSRRNSLSGPRPCNRYGRLARDCIALRW